MAPWSLEWEALLDPHERDSFLCRASLMLNEQRRAELQGDDGAMVFLSFMELLFSCFFFHFFLILFFLRRSCKLTHGHTARTYSSKFFTSKSPNAELNEGINISHSKAIALHLC